jgi:CubicO group peptidase (beta-lactamase class C family)
MLPLFLLAAPLPAQAPDAALLRRVDSVFSTWSRTSTPCCAVGVDRGGAPFLRRAYGMANLESGTPFTVGTISESGSTAKQFTAAAVVFLALEGKLGLDDDISRWIPEVKGFGKRITVRHILTHTSGLPDRYLLHAVEGREAGVVDHPNGEVMDVVSRLRELNFDPGEDYLYSNTGYVVAATLVERVSGKSLQAYTDEKIFRPLGMQDTRWREDHRVVVPGRAAAYTGTPATGFRNDHPFTRVIGSGGLNITVDDYLKWEAALQAGSGAWGAVRDSLEHVARLNDGTELTYGLGVIVDRWRGVRRVSHTGATGGYRAALYRFPEQNVAVALLCNGGAANPGALATGVAVAVLGNALGPVEPELPAIALDSTALSAYTGAWHSSRTGESRLLVVRTGQLVDSLSGLRLIPVGPGRFRVNGSPTMVTISDGPPRRMVASQANSRDVEYQPVDRPRLDAAGLAAYAGTYRSPELGASYALVVRGDTLLIDQGWRGTERFRYLFRDTFLGGDIGTVQFTRDARQRITGFVIWAGRVRHLRFDRVSR